MVGKKRKDPPTIDPSDDFAAKKKFLTIKFVTEVGEQFKQNHNYRIQVNKLSLADERSWINIVNQVKKK